MSTFLFVAGAWLGGWYRRDLRGGHYPMFTEPRAAASALTELPA